MYKIVLVEDEDTIRQGLKRLIEEVIDGFKIVGEAGNGKEAIELLKREHPDLLITDIRMPNMNGLQLASWIKDCYEQLPVIIISGYDDFNYAQEALRHGAKDYLLKPINRIELAQTLQNITRVLDDKKRTGQDYLNEKDKSEEGKEKRIIYEIKKMIHEHLDEDISLQYIAERVYLNPQYLSALFKNETEQNFSDYVTTCRMNKAKQLLSETQLKIYEVANLSGYVSVKHFMAVFKRLEGMTPSDYRKNKI